MDRFEFLSVLIYSISTIYPSRIEGLLYVGVYLRLHHDLEGRKGSQSRREGHLKQTSRNLWGDKQLSWQLQSQESKLQETHRRTTRNL